MDIAQIYKEFPDQESCARYLEKIRWDGVPRCPYCKSENSTLRLSGKQRRYWCNGCQRNFSVTVRTGFHHTHVPLQKWFLAIALMLNARKGISALQLSRDLNMSKNAAWRLTMRIRMAMFEFETPRVLTGDVEMDEAYIGGGPRKTNFRKRYKVTRSKRGRGTDKTPGHPHLPDVFQDWGAESGFGGDLGLQ